MQTKDDNIKTHHSDYYADLIHDSKQKRTRSRPATATQNAEARTAPISSTIYHATQQNTPTARHPTGRNLTFKSITVPSGLNNLQYR